VFKYYPHLYDLGIFKTWENLIAVDLVKRNCDLDYISHTLSLNIGLYVTLPNSIKLLGDKVFVQFITDE